MTVLSGALPNGAEREVTKRRDRLNALAASLDAMSPLKVLGRGYAIAAVGQPVQKLPAAV